MTASREALELAQEFIESLPEHIQIALVGGEPEDLRPRSVAEGVFARTIGRQYVLSKIEKALEAQNQN